MEDWEPVKKVWQFSYAPPYKPFLPILLLAISLLCLICGAVWLYVVSGNSYLYAPLLAAALILAFAAMRQGKIIGSSLIVLVLFVISAEQVYSFYINSSLGKLHASRIIIISQQEMPADALQNPRPIFSKDGSQILYLRSTFTDSSSQGKAEVVSIRTQDHRAIKKWILPAWPKLLCWNESRSKLAYISNVNKLHIMECNTTKDYELPVNFAAEELIWINNKKLARFNRNALQIDFLNLDDLTINKMTGAGDLQMRKWEEMTFAPASHENWIIRQGRLLNRSNDKYYRQSDDNSNALVDTNHLYIRSAKSPYERLLMPNGQTVINSSDCRQWIVFQGQNAPVTHYTLGSKAKSEIRYRIAFDGDNILKGAEKDSFKRLCEQNVPFFCEVYAPLINPMTNTSIAQIDPQKLQGYAKVIEWNSNYAIIDTASEIVPFDEKSLVKHIAPLNVSSGQLPSLGEYVTTIQPLEQ